MAEPGVESRTHLSLRVHPDVRDRLERAVRPSENRSRLAERLLDEGLRMDAHPGIVFRPGPAGRRPALSGGPDVWEVARVIRAQPDSEAGLEQAATLTGQPLHRIRIAARYYGEFTAEVDAWLAQVDRMADELSPG